VKSLGSGEIIGDLVDLDLGVEGASVLDTTPEMAFQKTGLVRGHYIFAQADSLAIALIDSDVVLTGVANVKFRRPVKVGERLIAKAEVIRRKGNEFVVSVVTRSNTEQVFRGKFLLAALAGSDWDCFIKQREGGQN